MKGTWLSLRNDSSNTLNPVGAEIPYEVLHRFGTPKKVIIDTEQELEPDLIIMAAHAHNMLGHLFLGSNTDHVLHNCKTPMFVYKQPKENVKAHRAVIPTI